MRNDKALGKVTQWVAGSALMSVALTAGSLSLYMNVTSGPLRRIKCERQHELSTEEMCLNEAKSAQISFSEAV
jgi:hypothetical protein